MKQGPFHEVIADCKRGLIQSVLHAHGGNRTKAARALGLQRTYLLRLMRDLGIQDHRPCHGTSK